MLGRSLMKDRQADARETSNEGEAIDKGDACVGEAIDEE